MTEIKQANGRTAPGGMKIPASSDILGYAQRLGWRRAFARGMYVAANQLTTVSILDCFRLGPQHVNRSLVDRGKFECRFLARHELLPIAARSEAPLDTILDEAARHGDAAYTIFDGPRLVSIGLYAAGPTPILGDLVVRFDTPDRYMYRGYTLAEYRGHRLHALGILRAALELFEQGVPQLVTVCERTNYPATISVLRMGWQPAGAIYRVSAGGWMHLGQTARARHIGMRLQRFASESIDRTMGKIHETS